MLAVPRTKFEKLPVGIHPRLSVQQLADPGPDHRVLMHPVRLQPSLGASPRRQLLSNRLDHPAVLISQQGQQRFLSSD